MTPSDFINLATTFVPGDVVVVTGADLAAIMIMLLDARDAIQAHTSYASMVYDSRALIMYPSDTEERGIQWEFVAIDARNNNKVILVANQFNRSLLPNPLTVEIDTVEDLMSSFTLSLIPLAASRNYPGTRGLFPFISRLYFYDENANVQFVKTQLQDRPGVD